MGTATAAYQSVAETTGLKQKDVKGIMEGLLAVAAGELKKQGSFKIGGALNLKLKSKPATPARKGVNPFTKEPCVFEAKPASKTVRALTVLDAGFALKTHGSFVKGLTPLRAGVAGFDFSFKLSAPAILKEPAFFPM